MFDFVSVEGMACRRRWVRCVQRFAGIFATVSDEWVLLGRNAIEGTFS